MHNLHCSGDFMSVEKMLRETCGLTRVEVGGLERIKVIKIRSDRDYGIWSRVRENEGRMRFFERLKEKKQNQSGSCKGVPLIHFHFICTAGPIMMQ